MGLHAVSVPSFGDSFFIGNQSSYQRAYEKGNVSVPSFGDSFFIITTTGDIAEISRVFPSPHSGILFLFDEFVLCCPQGVHVVSVPSFGDSFFINVLMRLTAAFRLTFPSPHSGILFLFTHEVIPAIRKVSVPSFGDSFFMKS